MSELYAAECPQCKAIGATLTFVNDPGFDRVDIVRPPRHRLKCLTCGFEWVPSGVVWTTPTEGPGA